MLRSLVRPVAAARPRLQQRQPQQMWARALSTAGNRWFLLMYEYVDDMLEKRPPFRPSHLEHADKYKNEGTLLLGGPLQDPVDGAAFVFQVDDADTVEEFVLADPYYTAGLITGYNIREWKIASGAERLR